MMFSVWVCRGIECSLKCPSESQTAPHSIGMYPMQSRPFRYRQSLAADCSECHITAISPLNFGCCPAAIIRGVIAIIVDPIKGMFVTWPRPHIFDKVFEGAQPTFANFDPSPAISGIGNVIGINATLSHSPIDHILRSSILAMFSRAFSRLLSAIAPARLRVSRTDLIFPDPNLSSANTLEEVKDVFPAWRMVVAHLSRVGQLVVLFARLERWYFLESHFLNYPFKFWLGPKRC
jgi:hypothetical protein